MGNKLVVEGELIDLQSCESGSSGLKVGPIWLSSSIEEVFDSQDIMSKCGRFIEGYRYGKVRVTIEQLVESE